MTSIWSASTAKVKNFPTTRVRKLSAYGPVWFMVFVCSALVYAGRRLDNAPIVEKYDVQVLKQIAPNEWSMVDDQGPFVYTACDDFPNAKVIWAGYVARKARWQEFGNCKSIRRQDLGFWWRDEQNQYKEITNVGTPGQVRIR